MDSHQAGGLTQPLPDTTPSQDNSGWKGPWAGNQSMFYRERREQHSDKLIDI